MKTHSFLVLALAIGISQLAGIIGSFFTIPAIPQWYDHLIKPELAPPNGVIGPIWTILFTLIGIAAFLVWRKGLHERAVKIALGLFGVQLILNTLWSIIFFGMRDPALAFIEITFLWIAILATIIAFAKVSKPAAWLLVPYIAWVTFAGYLNYSLWQLNGDPQTEILQPLPAEKTISEKSDFYTITAVYPEESLDTEGVMKQFVTEQVAQRMEAWKTGGDVYMQEKQLEQDFPDRPKMVYTLDIKYETIASPRNGTLSYIFHIGEYTGGANGDERVQTFTFGATGLLTVESFLNIAGYGAGTGNVNMGNDLTLSRLLLDKAAADATVFPDKDITREGLGLAYLKEDGVTLDHTLCNCDGFFYGSNLQNFAVTDTGMTFYFGKGAISIRAAGVVSIALTWRELEPYLQDSFTPTASTVSPS